MPAAATGVRYREEEQTMWTFMAPYVHQVLNLGGLVIQPQEWWQWWCCLWAFK